MVLLFVVLFVSSCSVDLRDDVLFVFFDVPVVESSSVVSGNVSSSSGFRVLNTVPNFDLFVKSFDVFRLSDFFLGDDLSVSIGLSEGFSVLESGSLVYFVGEVPGEWRSEINVFKGGELVYSQEFFVFVSVPSGSSDFVNYESPPRKSVLDEIVSFFRRGSRVEVVEGVEEDILGDEFCVLPRHIYSEEVSLVNALRSLNSSSSILDYVNNYFVLEVSDNLSMRSGFDVFKSDVGSEFEILRAVSYVLIINCYLQSYLVYEYDVVGGVNYSGLVFVRDVDGLKFFHFVDGVLVLESHSSKNNALSLVEGAKNIYINSYAYHPRDRIFEFWSRDVLDVTEWFVR